MGNVGLFCLSAYFGNIQLKGIPSVQDEFPDDTIQMTDEKINALAHHLTQTHFGKNAAAFTSGFAVGCPLCYHCRRLGGAIWGIPANTGSHQYVAGSHLNEGSGS